MKLGLEGKVVAITGGASGIGAACVASYLEEGALVAVCGRSADKLAMFQKKHSAMQDRLFCFQADIAIPEQLQHFCDEVLNNFGRLDIWYNNAGFGVRKPMMEVSIEDWDRQMNTNLRGVFLGCQTAARAMHSGGVIVNASSWGARMPVVGNGPYAVSKWGVEGLTRIFAAELAPRGIRVFAYMPGMIETELTHERIQQNLSGFTQSIALQRIGTPEDIAPTLVMLTSDKANYFTGCTIEISGGKFCVQNPIAAWNK